MTCLDSLRDVGGGLYEAAPPMMVTDVFLARSLAKFTVRWIRSYFVVGSYARKSRISCET